MRERPVSAVVGKAATFLTTKSESAWLFIFCVKKKGLRDCRIKYEAVRDYAKSEEKREFLRTSIEQRKFEDIHPDSDGNWTNVTDNDFRTL